MKDNVEEFVEKYQQLLMEEARKQYGEVAYERMTNPRFMGIIMDAEANSQVTGSCGDTMVVYLKLDRHRVKHAAFQTDGCGATIACGSFAAEMARGKTLEEVLDITGDAILEKCGGLPKENEHCATLAAGALHEAINGYMKRQTAPPENA
jgi:nitrogen fixation protein NifU and related proteins